MGRWLVAVVACGVVGCGGAQGAATTHPGARPVSVASHLPAGAVAYGRVDFSRLRTSAHAERVLGWYRKFVPAIPGFDPEHPGTRAFEALLAQTDELAVALYVGEPSPPVEPPEEGLPWQPPSEDREDGALLLLRTGVDLDWVEAQGATFEVELARRTHAGRPALVSLDPSGEQLMVVELGEGVVAVSIGWPGHLTERLDAALERMGTGATGLADAELAALLEAAGGQHAPVAVVGHIPPPLAAEVAGDMGGNEGPTKLRGLEGLRAAAFRMDPSSDLEMDVLLRLDDAARAETLAADLTAEGRRQAGNAFVLLLGLDLWLDHTEARAEGHDVHVALRLPEQDLRTWFFHVERLAAAAKAFFTEGGAGGALGGLFSGGFGSSPPPPPLAPVPDAEPPAVESPDGD
jgi:hypothetical protein